MPQDFTYDVEGHKFDKKTGGKVLQAYLLLRSKLADLPSSRCMD
jgi:hypothetical protein